MKRYWYWFLSLLVVSPVLGQEISADFFRFGVGGLGLGAGFFVGERVSVDVPVGYNFVEYEGFRKWKHISFQPGVRFWVAGRGGVLRGGRRGGRGLSGGGYGSDVSSGSVRGLRGVLPGVARGFFWGFHGHWAYYNVGNLPSFFSGYMQTHRFEGMLYGGGVGVGYRWLVGGRASLEAELGVGYARLEYDKYECLGCNSWRGRESRDYFGPTKASFNFVLSLGRASVVERWVVPLPSPSCVSLDSAALGATFSGDLFRLTPSFIVPEARPANARYERGVARIDFPLGGSEVLLDYGRNGVELSGVLSVIDSVRRDRRAAISSVVLTGYSSPDGSWEDNKTLSERRVASVEGYLRGVTGLPGSVFESSGAGEDWDGLRALVLESDPGYGDRVLRTIDDVGVFDGRERKLMDLGGGVAYRRMVLELFPLLRRVEYRVDYIMTPFDIESGKFRMRFHAEGLSLDEMFVVACSYDPESDDYYESFVTAARVYPRSDIANLNAAAAALMRRDADTAAAYLDRVVEKSPSWWDNLGIVFFLRGDIDRALSSFANAGLQGRENGRRLREHVVRD